MTGGPSSNRSDDNEQKHRDGFLGSWLRSGLAAMAIILALAGGGLALLDTPREEEPQINVPLIDVFVLAPGLTAGQVERRIVWPMEQTLFATSGVEYVYSSSFTGGAVITVRFYVGEDTVQSEVDVRNRLSRNQHRYSTEMTGYQIRPVYVDDVPFMTITLHSQRVDDAGLLSTAEELLVELTAIEGVGLVTIVGGRNVALEIELDPQRMAAHGISLADLERALRGANIRQAAGRLESADRGTDIEVGAPLSGPEDLGKLVVSAHEGGAVLLSDVAEFSLRPVEPDNYVSLSKGPAFEPGERRGPDAETLDNSAVTLALAKRPGVNAVRVSERVRQRVAQLKPLLLADDISLSVTRDYGASADDAVDWLVYSLLGASIVVMAVLAAVLGLREAAIVAVSVPTTFALTLLINYVADFTLNRVTLFALIVGLGLIVDDSIVSIDNIHRYLYTAAGKGLGRLARITAAVREVLPPMVLTSLVVVAAFVPLGFVTGLMGPYMAPMALIVSVAMIASTAVATLIVPWLAMLIASSGREIGDDAGDAGQSDAGDPERDAVSRSARYRLYHTVVAPLLDRRLFAFGMLAILILLFVGAVAMPFMGLIPLKLLPYDDAEKLQFVVDLPEDATAERTAAATRELARLAMRQPEVIDVAAYAGTASPVDFNGLVRRYYLREGPHVGDVRINLIEDERRSASSHDINLRLREQVQAIAARFDASVKTVERPPGPPVLAPVVAEVVGSPEMTYASLRHVASRVEEVFRDEPGVVDVDTSMESDAPSRLFQVDRQKAALAGLTPREVGRLVAAAVRGAELVWLREPHEMRPRPVHLRLPQERRTDESAIADLPIARVGNRVLTLQELGSFTHQTIDQVIERKNLRRVIYVTAEVAGRTPTSAVFDLRDRVDALFASGDLPPQACVRFDGEGEWFITKRVFRDLSIAFGVGVLAIYALLVYQTRSYGIPLILLSSVPLTIIGVMPGFWLLNVVFGGTVAGYDTTIPFTATAMIGLVALSGIAVRNSILLIDFTRSEQSRGCGVREALLRAGALRVRPILLTAGTAMLAVIPIAFDPVFSGLAWSLIFGLFVSTIFTLLLVPTLYHMVYRDYDASVI